MRSRISRSLLDRLVAEAAASPDREVCGLLFGSEGAIEAAASVRNVSAFPYSSFEIDPAALFEAIRAERAGGPSVAGYYHSHPFGPPEPSPRDAEAAAPDGRLWLILGGRGIGLYRAVDRGARHGRFDDVALEVLAS